jgi:hypothetical protein
MGLAVGRCTHEWYSHAGLLRIKVAISSRIRNSPYLSRHSLVSGEVTMSPHAKIYWSMLASVGLLCRYLAVRSWGLSSFCTLSSIVVMVNVIELRNEWTARIIAGRGWAGLLSALMPLILANVVLYAVRKHWPALTVLTVLKCQSSCHRTIDRLWHVDHVVKPRSIPNKASTQRCIWLWPSTWHISTDWIYRERCQHNTLEGTASGAFRPCIPSATWTCFSSTYERLVFFILLHNPSHQLIQPRNNEGHHPHRNRAVYKRCVLYSRNIKHVLPPIPYRVTDLVNTVGFRTKSLALIADAVRELRWSSLQAILTYMPSLPVSLPKCQFHDAAWCFFLTVILSGHCSLVSIWGFDMTLSYINITQCNRLHGSPCQFDSSATCYGGLNFLYQFHEKGKHVSGVRSIDLTFNWAIYN